MTNKIQIFDEINSLLNNQQFCVLATQGLEYPYCSLIAFVSSKDNKEIIFATLRQTSKFQNINNSSNVSLLIDTQSNNENDVKQAKALTVLGHAEEISGVNYDNYLAMYLKKYPYLKEFVNSPNCVIVKISVAKFILVSNFQNVSEYIIK